MNSTIGINFWSKLDSLICEGEIIIDRPKGSSHPLTNFNMKLVRAQVQDAEALWKMQIEAFSELYEKYKDTENSPATEPLDKMVMRLKQSFTYYYFIKVDDQIVGAIRVVDRKDNNVPKRISPIFIMKEYRGRGYAQRAIQLAEDIHGTSNWELDTIQQEKGNCYLYEKKGYRRTGETKVVNERMTLIFYHKY